MTLSVTSFDFTKNLPLRRENLTHPLTLLFGAAIASLTVGIILYRRWNVQPTSFDGAQKAYAKKKYQDTLEHCLRALRFKVGSPSEIHLLCAKAHIGLKKYDEAIGACGLALADSAHPKKNLVFLADVNLQWGKALANLGDWDAALAKYELSWKTVSVFADPFDSPRLKFEILIEMARALRKTKEHSRIQQALDLACGNLYLLVPTKEVSEENRGLFIQFYYTRIYYFLDTGSPIPAFLNCMSALEHLGKPSNDPELRMKAEILLLLSALLIKSGKAEEAFKKAEEVMHLDIIIENKEILIAAHLLRALTSSDDKLVSYNYKEALDHAQRNRVLEAAILCKRGDFHLQKGKAASDETAMELFTKALLDFEAALKKLDAMDSASVGSDFLISLFRILGLTDLKKRLGERLKDENLTTARSLRQLQQRTGNSQK
ncbi:MAG: hypothetical protein JSS10_00320 [Verrucomicrobia bacterium]|nr:hypothetical protein [Verrucomicrobiota bacterium]